MFDPGYRRALVDPEQKFAALQSRRSTSRFSGAASAQPAVGSC